MRWGLAAILFMPLFSFAQIDLGDFQTSIESIQGFITSSLIPIVFTLALVFFLWGLAKFILNAGDEEARESGKKLMIWGLVAFVVMVSVWGLVALVRNTLGINNATTISPPGLPGPSQP